MGLPNDNDKLARIRELSEIINSKSAQFCTPKRNLLSINL